MDITAREVVRRKEPLFRELGLDEKDVTDDELLDALADNPILINLLIVVLEDGENVAVRLCRPSALVTLSAQTSCSTIAGTAPFSSRAALTISLAEYAKF